MYAERENKPKSYNNDVLHKKTHQPSSVQMRVAYTNRAGNFIRNAKQIIDSEEIRRAAIAIQKSKGGDGPEALDGDWKYEKSDNENFIVGHGNNDKLDDYSPTLLAEQLIRHDISSENKVTLVACDTGSLNGFAKKVIEALQLQAKPKIRINAPNSPVFVKSTGEFKLIRPGTKNKKGSMHNALVNQIAKAKKVDQNTIKLLMLKISTTINDADRWKKFLSSFPESIITEIDHDIESEFHESEIAKNESTSNSQAESYRHQPEEKLTLEMRISRFFHKYSSDRELNELERACLITNIENHFSDIDGVYDALIVLHDSSMEIADEFAKRVDDYGDKKEKYNESEEYSIPEKMVEFYVEESDLKKAITGRRRMLESSDDESGDEQDV
jgi:Peptidase C80 family